MLVLDASALVDVLARLPRGERVLQRLGGDHLAAPDLLVPEVTSALARLERAGVLDEVSLQAAVDDLVALPVSLLPCRDLLPTVVGLRSALRVSDAFYVAAAAALGAPLLTTDGRLARSGVRGVDVLLVA